MPTPFTILQAVQAHSTAAPTTITATLVATQPNSLLIAIVAATGGTPAAPTTPAGWNVIRPPILTNGFGYAVWALPNNPGGLTSLIVTLNGTPQGAALDVFELGGLTELVRLSVSDNGGTGTATSGPGSGTTLMGTLEELCIAMVAHVAATATYTGAPELYAYLNNTSTGGTTNITLNAVIGPLPYNRQLLLPSMSFSASVTWQAVLSQNFVDGGGAARRGPNGLMASGSGYSGALGGL